MKIKSIFKQLSGLIVIGLLFLSITTFAQSISKASLNKKTSITLLSDDGTTTSVKFSVGSFEEQLVLTPKGNAVIIKTDECTQILKAGFPDLAKLTASIIIPDQSSMKVEVAGSEYEDYENIIVAPSKGSITRNIDPSSIPFTYNEVYDQDAFFPKNITELREPYIIRDYRAQTIIVYPFQYNPVTKTLRVYSEITVKVSPDDSKEVSNILIRKKPIEKIQTDFGNIYSHHFLNYNNGTRYTPLPDHGNMLVICYEDFMDEIQPYVDWKIQEGIKTELVDVATIGNASAAIKSYVANYYNTYGLTYLVFVGDDAQVKTSYVSGVGDSDNDYGYILGNDHYQEIFVGRFSAESESDVTNQVNKTLEYEKNPVIDGYYNKGVAIASDQGPGDDNQYDWEHERGLRDQLLAYTYSDVTELYDGTHAGGNDASGNPTDQNLADKINAGTGIINYTGHGSSTSIVTTGFNNADVNALTNQNKWPFLWIVGCVTGDFKSQTCFAETWARAVYENKPTGSIDNFMSTINQYWDEPMQGQDEMNSILVDSYADNKPRSFAGICINGCFSMNDHYGNSGEDMTDTWVVFGDPSLMIRTAQPELMTVSHEPELTIGVSSFAVNCDFENAFVALTQNGNIIGTQWVSGGIANITFTPIIESDSAIVTITAFNKVPYIKTIPVVESVAPYVINTSNFIVDALGNNNGLADYNENISLNVTLKNVGASTAQNVKAVLATSDPFITITDNTQDFGDLVNNIEAIQNDAVAFIVSDGIPDQHVVYFSYTITDDQLNSWNGNFSITVNAPLLTVTGFVIDDSNGNNDGNLDPGENAIISITNNNTGHSPTINSIATLLESNEYIEVLTAPMDAGILNAGESSVAAFSVFVYSNTPYGIDVPFNYSITAGEYSATLDFSSTVTPAIEDFETADFTKFDWLFAGNSNFTVQSQTVYEGTYATKSGNIGNNKSSTLKITIDAMFDDDISFMSKISSEDGFDSLSFHIDGVSKGHWSGDIDWTPHTYSVAAGTHTYEWTYKKDEGYSYGSDCVWLDNIILPAYKENPASGIINIGGEENISVYPNPFSQISFINYTIDAGALVTVKVYDVLGKEVKTLINNQQQPAGNYQLGFEGNELINGIYFCHLNIGEKTFVKKIELNK
ncbi:MAG: C25 family cysteine peptidase [Chitinophagales bacterium]|nr:C25 family cysteine peptidase [Chitinophagales bacterium]